MLFLSLACLPSIRLRAIGKGVFAETTAMGTRVSASGKSAKAEIWLGD